MKTAFRSILSILLCVIMVCSAALPAKSETRVEASGVTDVAATFGKTRILAKITAHEIEIGKSSDPRPEKVFSSCTYSHFPCSSIDYLEIFVNGNPLFVARSVYADMADVNKANLLQMKKGKFVLILNGGDASESYTVKIIFDESLVRQRIYISNETKQIMQRTTFFASPSLDE